MILTIRSEWMKFVSSIWCVVGVFIALLLQPILLFAGLSFAGSLTASLALEQMLQALYVSQVGIIIMSASFFGQEYFDSSLRTTFLSNSNRTKVLVAKALILAITSLVAGAISVSLGIVVALFHNVNFIFSDFGKIALNMFSWTMIGWISGFITVVLKSHIISMAIIIPLLLAVNQLLVALSSVFRFLPDIAMRNVFTIYPNEMLLTAQAGIVTQLIWAFVMGVVAIWFNLRRDVR